eukprot:6661075-Prymnesium_polylepis.1
MEARDEERVGRILERRVDGDPRLEQQLEAAQLAHLRGVRARRSVCAREAARQRGALEKTARKAAKSGEGWESRCDGCVRGGTRRYAAAAPGVWLTCDAMHSGSAPASRAQRRETPPDMSASNSSTHTACPFSHAIGTRPSEGEPFARKGSTGALACSAFALASSSSRVHSRWPCWQAIERGVARPLARPPWCGAARAASSSSTHAACPFCAAMYSGVATERCCTLTGAPAASRMRTHSTRPCSHATASGDVGFRPASRPSPAPLSVAAGAACSSGLGALGGAPPPLRAARRVASASRRRRTQSAAPSSGAAHANASASWSMSAPAASTASTQRCEPVRQESCSGEPIDAARVVDRCRAGGRVRSAWAREREHGAGKTDRRRVGRERAAVGAAHPRCCARGHSGWRRGRAAPAPDRACLAGTRRAGGRPGCSACRRDGRQSSPGALREPHGDTTLEASSQTGEPQWWHSGHRSVALGGGSRGKACLLTQHRPQVRRVTHTLTRRQHPTPHPPHHPTPDLAR